MYRKYFKGPKKFVSQQAFIIITFMGQKKLCPRLNSKAVLLCVQSCTHVVLSFHEIYKDNLILPDHWGVF